MTITACHSLISFPSKILKGSGSLDQLPTLITATRVFIIGGKTALECTLPTIMTQFGVNINIESAWFGGEVSAKNHQALVAKGNEFGAEIIIAVGGGKALDIGKWVADSLTLPIVTIPTIAATCAATSTVSIVYDDHGCYERMVSLSNAPQLVVLDSQVIANAPTRWLAAGLGDTLAKLYEFRAIVDSLPTCSSNYAAHANGKLCFDLIERYGEQSIQDCNNNQSSSAIEAVMDAIILFAGFTSILGVGDHVAAAHGLFDGFTFNDKTREFGHGLLVGFGNLVLLALEGRDDEEIIVAIELAKRCSIPTHINEIANLTEAELNEIALHAVNTSDMKNMPKPISQADLIQAIKRVSFISEKLF